MSYTISLYKNTSGIHHINKSITLIADTVCELKNPQDVETPEIYIAATDAYDGVNYVYIPEFGRYYYAKALPGRGQTITFSCESDPLMSFKAGVKAAPAVISRNPWHWDLYVHDPKMPVEARTASAVIKFPGTHFNGQNNCYILTTLGG